jgi:adenylate cyclase
VSEGRRKLVAIMMTDMVGYTSLTRTNEAQALSMLEAQRAMLRELFPKYNGAEIKTIGDAFLVEFESAREAVMCALDIQRSVHQRNSVEGGEPILLRIGIHTGDVIHRERDVFGDTVNVLSRIEPLADPGGMCVSQQVFDQVRGSVNCMFLKIEGAPMKGVDTPVAVYRALLPWTSGQAKKPGLAPDKRRVAVLPFTNISPEKSDEYFVDGMTEEMIGKLSRIGGLQVIARASAMRYKGKDKTLSEIGAELNVGSVLDGSVRKHADKIRVSVELVDVETQSQVWSNTYDRQLTDVFAIQSDIAESVVKELQIAHFPEEERKAEKEVDIVAYGYYLKGRHLLYARTEEALKEAAKQFRIAMARDQYFARAFAGLADCLYLLGYYGYSPAMETYAEARKVVNNALALDDGLAEAHTTLGVLLVQSEYNTSDAEREFKKAVELDPGYAQAHHWYAFTLACMGRLEEAIVQMETAQQADPLSPVIATVLGGFYFESGGEAQALKQWDLAAKLDPNISILETWKGEYLIAKGRLDEAITRLQGELARAPTNASALAMIGYAYARAERRDEALKMLDRLQALDKHGTLNASFVGFVHVGLGNLDAYFRCAEQALADRSLDLAFLRCSPLMTPVRADPRYRELLERVRSNQPKT